MSATRDEYLNALHKVVRQPRRPTTPPTSSPSPVPPKAPPPTKQDRQCSSCSLPLQSSNSKLTGRCFCCRSFNTYPDLSNIEPDSNQSKRRSLVRRRRADIREFRRAYCEMEKFATTSEKAYSYIKLWKAGAYARLFGGDCYRVRPDLVFAWEKGWAAMDEHLSGKSNWPVKAQGMRRYDRNQPEIFVRWLKGAPGPQTRQSVFIERIETTGARSMVLVCTKHSIPPTRQWVLVSDITFDDGTVANIDLLESWKLLPD